MFNDEFKYKLSNLQIAVLISLAFFLSAALMYFENQELRSKINTNRNYNNEITQLNNEITNLNNNLETSKEKTNNLFQCQKLHAEAATGLIDSDMIVLSAEYVQNIESKELYRQYNIMLETLSSMQDHCINAIYDKNNIKDDLTLNYLINNNCLTVLDLHRLLILERNLILYMYNDCWKNTELKTDNEFYFKLANIEENI